MTHLLAFLAGAVCALALARWIARFLENDTYL